MLTKKVLISSIFITLFLTSNSYSSQTYFNDEKILKILLNGKYDKKANYISHDLSKEIIKEYQLENVSKFMTSIILKKEFKQNGKINYIVVTETRDETSDCHACAPIVGIATFEKFGTNLKIKDKFQYVERIGTWGHAPDPEFKEIGKDNFGLVFNSDYSGMGMNTGDTIIIGKVNNSFKSLITEHTYESNSGMCGADVDRECYSYEAKLDFIKSKDKFYSINFTYKGTILDNNYKTISYNKSKKYKFSKDKYIPY